jgi:hypothetical protein
MPHPESHVPRVPGESWHLATGSCLPIRLPWRLRARPSATLHEIQGLLRRANLSSKSYKETAASVKGLHTSSKLVTVELEVSLIILNENTCIGRALKRETARFYPDPNKTPLTGPKSAYFSTVSALERTRTEKSA